MTHSITHESHEPVAVERVPTGVPGLDTILGGGLVRGAIYLVMGKPGTGKTTLANQVCFGHVRGGGRAVYVTLLAESHSSMVKHLQGMRFFDPAAVNKSLVYVGAYRSLRDDRLKGLLQLIRRVIDDEKASMLVLDGISPAQALAGSDVALKEFIIELQVLAGMTNCTVLLLTNMTAEDASGPEHTMVDGLLELAFERGRRRPARTLEVLKFRGGPHLLGRHELIITSEGIAVYPRVEDVFNGMRRKISASTRRLSTGVPMLDEMLRGGVLSGTTTVVLGFSGSGKTTLGLHFLDAGCRRNETGLYFGFFEQPERLLASADNLALDLRSYEESGLFRQIWQPGHEYGLDALTARLMEDVERRGVQRLVIDGLEGFRQATSDPDRTIRFLTALTNELRSRDITTLIMDETPQAHGPEIQLRVEGTSALAENMLLLEYLRVGTELRRLISVAKQRASVHAGEIREFSLTARGIDISVDTLTAEDILSSPAAPGLQRNRKARPGTDT